jgi:biopolymer transport protein ExbD
VNAGGGEFLRGAQVFVRPLRLSGQRTFENSFFAGRVARDTSGVAASKDSSGKFGQAASHVWGFGQVYLLSEVNDMRDEHAETSSWARPGINVTPMIDILLVLLIIFMVLTPLRPARFKTLIPQPPEDTRERVSPRTLIVSVGQDLSLKLIRGDTVVAEGSVSDPNDVASRIAREWQQRKDTGQWKTGFEGRADLPPDERIERTVFVRAPRSLAYGDVAKVIDSIKGAGAQPVGLQTDELPN